VIRTLIVIAALLTLAASTALAAPPAGKGKHESSGAAAAAGQSTEKKSKKCKAERASTGANAFGKCVSSKDKAKGDDQDEAEAANEANESKAEDNAAKKCKAERAMGIDAFKARHGTNPNKANAFGKCVSKLAKAKNSS